MSSQMAEGGEVISLRHRLHSTNQKHFFIFISSIHFFLRLSKPQGLVRMEGLCNLLKIIHIIRSQAHNFPACSLEP
jgi:hypothetical protein